MGGDPGVLNRSAADRAAPPMATTVTIGPARPTPNAAAPQSSERTVAQQDPEQIGRHPIDDSGTPRRIVLVDGIAGRIQAESAAVLAARTGIVRADIFGGTSIITPSLAISIVGLLHGIAQY